MASVPLYLQNLGGLTSFSGSVMPMSLIILRCSLGKLHSRINLTCVTVLFVNREFQAFLKKYFSIKMEMGQDH